LPEERVPFEVRQVRSGERRSEQEAQMLRMSLLIAGALAALPAASAHADEIADFLAQFSGAWQGSGEFLIGPEDGLEFRCTLAGDPSGNGLAFGMTGRCWVGRLSADIHATLRYNSETDRFYGDFLGGSEGDGLDVVGERDGDGFSLALSRGGIQGRLDAEPVDVGRMRVVISYRDPASDRELPVVAMGFWRSGAAAAAPPHYRPDIAAGTAGPGD
jgi:hypothetical protein